MDELRGDQPTFWQWVERNEIDWGWFVEKAYSEAQSDWKYAPLLFVLRKLVQSLEKQDRRKAEYYASSTQYILEEK
jgi:hypothetical protein